MPGGVKQRRVFLLTDGSVSNTNQVIQSIRQHCRNGDHTKVFSFGIGSGCSQHLVKEAAIAGKGEYCFVGDHQMSELRSKVIHSLNIASQQALQGCTFKFNWIPQDNKDGTLASKTNYEMGNIQRN